MRVEQVDVTKRSIRLEPGTTKNGEGREVSMTPAVFELLRACVEGKQVGDHVFTRPNGHAVRVFRRVWTRACCKSGVGWMICGTCTEAVSICTCEKAKKRPKYTGLIFHDLRRTAARGLRRAGVAEGIIMKIGGWRTRSVFERYAIVSQSDINDAMSKLETCRAEDAQRVIQLGDEPGEARQVSGKPQ
jgi:integrase